MRLMRIAMFVQQLDDAIMQLASFVVLNEGDDIIEGHHYVVLPSEGRKEQAWSDTDLVKLIVCAGAVTATHPDEIDELSRNDLP